MCVCISDGGGGCFYLFVAEDVEGSEGNVPLAQDLYDLPAEAATRRVGGAFHEQHDGGGVDEGT